MKKLLKLKRTDPRIPCRQSRTFEIPISDNKDKKEGRPKKFIGVQTENEGSNLEVFLTPMTLPMRGEIWLPRQQRLLLV